MKIISIENDSNNSRIKGIIYEESQKCDEKKFRMQTWRNSKNNGQKSIYR